MAPGIEAEPLHQPGELFPQARHRFRWRVERGAGPQYAGRGRYPAGREQISRQQKRAQTTRSEREYDLPLNENQVEYPISLVSPSYHRFVEHVPTTPDVETESVLPEAEES